MKYTQRGFALLIAVIFMSVMLALGLALASLSYKQQVLASSAVQSQYAFYAADAALECALLADNKDNFFSPPNGRTPFVCNGQFPVSTSTSSGFLVSNVRISPDSALCADITVYKPLVTPGTTYIFSQGYDVPCTTVANPGGARFVARGINAHY